MSQGTESPDPIREPEPTRPGELIVVGGGMVAQRLVEALRDRDAAGRWRPPSWPPTSAAATPKTSPSATPPCGAIRWSPCAAAPRSPNSTAQAGSSPWPTATGCTTTDLELRYRGLRAPHKLKLGISGCARECAEARSKDVGVIATEKGWNLYVGGNGGFTPRGNLVVRLKGGDPYLLGRGGEEARACRDAGVEVHVVPGVSSAIAAPAAAGIRR